MIIALSLVTGLVLAVVYELAWVRMQQWLFSRFRKVAPLLSVVGFWVRLVVLGLVFLALWRLTPLNLFVTALAFAAGFTVMSIVLIARLTKKTPAASQEDEAGAQDGVPPSDEDGTGAGPKDDVLP